MRLKSVIENIYETFELDENHKTMCVGENPLYGSKLSLFREDIVNTDEFVNCDYVGFISTPIIKNSVGDVVTAQTIKVGDRMRFIGKCYILSIDLSPEMYNPADVFTTIKNGAGITPSLYNPKDMSQYKRIILDVSPEKLQDSLELTENENELTERGRILKVIEDVLNNPNEYTIKGKREVLVRGFFNVDKDKIKEDDFTSFNDNYFTVYYMKPTNVGDNEIALELKTEVIPIKYKDDFLLTLDDTKIIVEEDLNKFKTKHNLI